MIPDDLFLKMVCPYLSPIAMYKARMVGYNTSILRFLKQKRIDPKEIEDYVCPCCGDWLFEEWNDISELIYDHFDGFHTDHSVFNPHVRFRFAQKILWKFYDEVCGLYPVSTNTIVRRSILCKRCQLKRYSENSIVYVGTRMYRRSTACGIIYYKKKGQSLIYWDEMIDPSLGKIKLK
jgi:hypothetical protein